ncbi:MAG: UDP-3-O-(3-hydroxymyristoyl)glucosamine N-acyltransferase, partial [Phycisphaerae bacterium]|nr:UDP-3-O-(3-hydroxymyristoyl)glucosamine N-acyltransferase [Phycisphaerae bacterium]
RDVTLGENCHLWPNVVIQWGCKLGKGVILHSGVVIGTDGYGYSLIEGKHCKIPHIGIVVIDDDVEIGACSCIDRAKFDRTVVGRGTKIDNMVQVGHNTIIGENCLLVAQVGISGSVELGNYVVLAGRSGAADHVKIGDGAVLTAQAVATKDVPPGSKMIDIPARDIREFVREIKMMKKLPKIIKKVESL